MPIELLIVKIIQEYTAYQKRRRKEDDILVKKRIIDELTSLRSMIQQFSQETNFAEATLFKEGKSIVNRIDEFIQEIEYSLSGHSYSFFSPQSSVGMMQLKKIMKFDLSLLKGSIDLITRFERFQSDYAEAKQDMLFATLRPINQALTDLKTTFRSRDNLIKKI